MHQVKPITEREFMAQVLQLAKLRGWRSYHTHDSRRSAAGFPDLVLVRGSRVVFVELKTDKGKLTREQESWLDALRSAAQFAYVWRPADWDKIMEVLQ